MEQNHHHLCLQNLIDGCTEERLHDATTRLSKCINCPRDGGACEGDTRQGEVPVWDYTLIKTGNLVWKECESWRMFLRLQRMIRDGFPRKLLELNLEELDSRNTVDSFALSDVRNYAAQFEEHRKTGKGVTLCGPVGPGKTQLAVSLCRGLMLTRVVRRVVFWEVTDMLTSLRQGSDEERRRLIEASKGADILVLDDLGAHKSSEWVREQLGSIINHRWSNALPIVVTTNESLNTFTETLGERTVSRLQSSNMQVPVGGGDRRVQ